MSYQIKSTPYFQRMLTKSKRNGELQRLKEEYERIKDFNDHTISLRIRQVRLRRLFREIQDINSTIRPRPRRPAQKTYAQMRAEELARARELGKEYSRENAMGVPRYDPFGSQSSTSMGAVGRRQLQAKPSSTARRLNYGNSMSAYNMKKFQQSQRRSYERTTASIQNNLNYVSSFELERMERLQKCIDYKQSDYKQSDSSLPFKDKHNNSNVTSEAYKPLPATAEVVQVEEAMDDAGENVAEESFSQTDVVKNYTFVLGDDGTINIDENALEYIRATNEIVVDDDDEQYVPIANVLRNAPQLFKNLKDCENAGREKVLEHLYQQTLDDDDSVPDDIEEENALRKISNDRNLPLSMFHKYGLPTITSVDDTQYIENEELIKVSKLGENYLVSHDDDGFENNNAENSDRNRQNEKLSREQQSSPKAFYSEKSENESISLKNKLLPAQAKRPLSPALLANGEVKDFVKLYEPFPKDEDHPAPVKESFEPGVARLRSIFEHQGE